jgi:hypothetical protein
MTKNQRLAILVVLVTALVAVVIMAPVFAQTVSSDASKATVMKGTKGTGTADNDPNIKGKSPDNDPNAKVPPPPGKGAATRGPNPWPCRVNVDNRTGWKIQVYVDGQYDGLSSPWGNAYMNTGSGTTGFYAIATFTDGSKVTWGPWSFACPANGTFTWTLNP